MDSNQWLVKKEGEEGKAGHRAENSKWREKNLWDNYNMASQMRCTYAQFKTTNFILETCIVC